MSFPKTTPLAKQSPWQGAITLDLKTTYCGPLPVPLSPMLYVTDEDTSAKQEAPRSHQQWPMLLGVQNTHLLMYQCCLLASSTPNCTTSLDASVQDPPQGRRHHCCNNAHRHTVNNGHLQTCHLTIGSTHTFGINNTATDASNKAIGNILLTPVTVGSFWAWHIIRLNPCNMTNPHISPTMMA